MTGRLSTRSAMAAAALLVFVSPLLAQQGAEHADLAQSVLFYEDGEDMTSPYAGVKISGSIRVEPGKIGKALLIERRTVNQVADGDFEKPIGEPWSLPTSARREEKGGIAGSACLRMDGGVEPVALPLVDLKPKRPHAFSFFIKRAGNAAANVSVTMTSGGKETSLVSDRAVSDAFERVELAIYPPADNVTIRIISTGPVLIDDVQLDPGVSFFNTFAKPLVRRYVDRIEIPADGRYFHPASGAFACWVKVPWLTNQTFSDDGLGLIGVQNAPEKQKKWADQFVLFINAWTKRDFDNPKDRGSLNMVTLDDQAKPAQLSAMLDEIKPTDDGWHHLAFTWEKRGDSMHMEMFIDEGALHAETDRPLGALKTPTEIYIGYTGGAYLNGLLDEAAIFSRPLTADEVKWLAARSEPLGDLLNNKGSKP